MSPDLILITMNLYKSVFIFLSILLLVSSDYKHRVNRLSNNKTSIIVKIENGLVQGSRMSDKLIAFRGIPYAQPPIGNLRFELPKKPHNWNGIWNATYDRSECIAANSIYSSGGGDEDCLYINVYIPQYPVSGVLLPVMVWIYGGGFVGGSSKYELYGSDYLVQKNVIFVSFNYRTGIFGFLSTGDEVAPGNNGLQDQIFALKWVRQNIRAFGGAQNNVTIFGESAGANSVSYLMLSRRAKGLFKSAIMESGSALCLGSFSTRARTFAFLVGNRFGIYTTNSSELVYQLKKVPASILNTISEIGVYQLNLLDDVVYGAVIEPEHKDAVLTTYIYELLAKGQFNQVPSIIGFNSAEGLFFVTPSTLCIYYLIRYDLFPDELVSYDMNANTTELSAIGQKIKTHYAGQNGTLACPDDNFTLYLSDTQFVRPILKTAELMSNYSPTYLYTFSYTTDPNALGVPHSGELKYIFKYNLTTPEEIRVRNCMVDLFTNFAKYSDPTPSSDICSGNVVWKPVTPNGNQTYYLNINKIVTLGINPNKRDQDFWNYLYEKYGSRPFNTY